MTGIAQNMGEDPVKLAKAFIMEGLQLDLPVINAIRTPERNGRPGILKIQLQSKGDKEKALKAKQGLKDSAKYKKVFVRAYQSVEQRIMYNNTKMLLEATGTRE